MPVWAFEGFWSILEEARKEAERPENMHPDEWREWLDHGEEWVRQQCQNLE